jgi:hypothetical protein
MIVLFISIVCVKSILDFIKAIKSKSVSGVGGKSNGRD